MPTKISQTECPHRLPTVCVDDMFVTQLSVPSMVAQTVVPQRHQQHTTKTSTANIHITAHATTAAANTTATTTTTKTQSYSNHELLLLLLIKQLSIFTFKYVCAF